MWFLSTIAQASPLEWTRPPLPAGEQCKVEATINADGTVGGVEVRGCAPELRPGVAAAVQQWRYAPEGTSKALSLTVKGAGPSDRVLRTVRPGFAAGEGRTCAARFRLHEDGSWTEVEVTGCATEEETARWTEALQAWRFGPGRAEPVFAVASTDFPAPLVRVAPEYPASERAVDHGRVACQVLVRVTGGVPEPLDAVGCPEAFQRAATDALKKWRYARDEAPFTLPVSLSFAVR